MNSNLHSKSQQESHLVLCRSFERKASTPFSIGKLLRDFSIRYIGVFQNPSRRPASIPKTINASKITLCLPSSLVTVTGTTMSQLRMANSIGSCTTATACEQKWCTVCFVKTVKHSPGSYRVRPVRKTHGYFVGLVFYRKVATYLRRFSRTHTARGF